MLLSVWCEFIYDLYYIKLSMNKTHWRINKHFTRVEQIPRKWRKGVFSITFNIEQLSNYSLLWIFQKITHPMQWAGFGNAGMVAETGQSPLSMMIFWPNGTFNNPGSIFIKKLKFSNKFENVGKIWAKSPIVRRG